MQAEIYPVASTCKDGGTEFKAAGCDQVCYALNKFSLLVYQCDFLRISKAWLDNEFHCRLAEECDT